MARCVIILGMRVGEHLRLTGGALKQWFIAQSYDALAVAGLWLIGLLLLRVPLAILWAALGAVLQFVPNVGPALTKRPEALKVFVFHVPIFGRRSLKVRGCRCP